MIKEILKLMCKGNLTLKEAAHNLKIGQDELKNRLEMMERMGFIRSVSDPPTCGTGCTLCPMAKGCPSNDSKDSFGTGYVLTEKGRKIRGE